MKGLLLKDLYMMKKYCKAAFLIVIGFIALSVVDTSNLFFIFYPCMIGGAIPATLLAYDERSRWLQYSETMPYTKGEIVSSKYLIGLLIQVAILIVTGVVQAIRMRIQGTFQLNEYIVLMVLLVIIASIASSITLPFIFKFGVEKGRVAYYAMIGIVCIGSGVSSALMTKEMQEEIKVDSVLPILLLVGIGVYALSWYLSIFFYEKREL